MHRPPCVRPGLHAARHAARPRDPSARDRRDARLGGRIVAPRHPRRARRAGRELPRRRREGRVGGGARGRGAEGDVDRLAKGCLATRISTAIRARPRSSAIRQSSIAAMRRRRCEARRRRCRRPTSGRSRATRRSARHAPSPTCAPMAARPSGRASQGIHGLRTNLAKVFGLPLDKMRVVFLEGSGSYGTNGGDHVAADAVLLSKTVGQPVRVQWMRQDEHGWDPEGPAAAAGSACRPRRGRTDRRVGDRDVGAERGAGRARAARRRRRRPRAGARPGRRRDHAERRPALRRPTTSACRALDQGDAAAAVESSRAGQDCERVRGRRRSPTSSRRRPAWIRWSSA